MMGRRILYITLFGVAMGFLEAAVVVYLRRLFYPGGFGFPLVMLPLDLTLVEVGREAATLVMLGSVAMLTGRTGVERFAWFSVLFGTWDLVYYAGLKLVLGWPPSFLTWDILFLIPVIWVGPVLAPVLVSLGLIAAGSTLVWFEARRVRIQLERIDVGLLALSLALLLAAFVANHGTVVRGGSPARFPWGPFALAFALAILVAIKALRTGRRRTLPRRYGLR